MLADLGLLYCAFFWGVTFPAMKILVGIYPPCWLLFLRFSVGSAMIYVFFHRRIHASFRKVLKGGVVIELKQDGRARSEMKSILLKHRVKPVKVSKYCIGITLTNPDARPGRFKEKVRKIEKQIKDKLL